MTKKVEILMFNLKPVGDKVVLDPITYLPLPKEGKEVPASTYWRRQLRDGAVEKFTKQKTTTQKKKEA